MKHKKERFELLENTFWEFENILKKIIEKLISISL
jgi:hypothetical protein